LNGLSAIYIDCETDAGEGYRLVTRIFRKCGTMATRNARFPASELRRILPLTQHGIGLGPSGKGDPPRPLDELALDFVELKPTADRENPEFFDAVRLALAEFVGVTFSGTFENARAQLRKAASGRGELSPELLDAAETFCASLNHFALGEISRERVEFLRATVAHERKRIGLDEKRPAPGAAIERGTAAHAYAEGRNRIDEKLRELRVLLDDHHLEQGGLPGSWGFVGDLGAAEERLDDVLAIFKPEPDDR
jgi:hypothetical protein